jgi:hypothetical protein
MNEAVILGSLLASAGSILAVIKFWMDMGRTLAKAEKSERDFIFLSAKHDLMAGGLADYKVEAAKQFASYTALQVAENRFSNAVEGMRGDFGRLTERLDRLIERMDK